MKKKLSRSPRQGFALIIAITLMAFILLLLVGTSTMVSVESQTATQISRLDDARQNALYGLRVAMGQLQKYAGPDQRATAPATTVYPTKDFNELYDGDTETGASDEDHMWFHYRENAKQSTNYSYLDKVETWLTHDERESFDQAVKDWWNENDRNPHWTAVFDSSLRVDRYGSVSGIRDLDAQIYEEDPDTTFGEFKRDQEPAWLVSGNEELEPGDAEYLTPDAPLTGDDVIDIVAYGSAAPADAQPGDPAESVDGLDGKVTVRKQPIMDGSGETTGHFAYWVGDESLKANFSVRDQFADANLNPIADAEQGSVNYRNRLQVPQRIGWEALSSFRELFENGAVDVGPNDERLEFVVTSGNIPVLDDQFEEPTREAFHHLTGFSKSLLTNNALGGLKLDLTAFLERGDGGPGGFPRSIRESDPMANPDYYDEDDSRFQVYGGNNTGFPESTSAALDGIPLWEELTGWYNNFERVNAGTDGDVTLSIDPDSNTAPVITYMGFHAGMSYDTTSNELLWHWLPVVVLWNPYDVRLNSGSYELDIGITARLSETYVVYDPWREGVIPENRAPDRERLQQDSEAKWAMRDLNGDGSMVLSYKTGVDASGNETFAEWDNRDPDTVDVGEIRSSLPFQDDELKNGWTDPFGRYFYYLENPRTGDVSDERGDNLSPTGYRMALRTNIHSEVEPSGLFEDENQRLKFRISSTFEAGEARIFSLANNVKWSPGDEISLQSGLDVAFPPSIQVTLAEANIADLNNVRFIAETITGSVDTHLNPNVEFRINSGPVPGTILRSTRFGNVNYSILNSNIRGQDFLDVAGWKRPGERSDSDGDGVSDQDEALPKFTNTWRPLYATSDFEREVIAGTTRATRNSIFAMGHRFLEPFNTDGIQDLEVQRIPAFSRFNLGASSFDGHPQVDQVRSRFGSRNWHGNDEEGLSTVLYLIDESRHGWGEGLSDGDQGYALVTYREYDQFSSAQPYEPLSELPIRNARRQQSEVLSLGQFQQVNLSPYVWQPSFPIANSDAGIYNDREAIAGINSREVGVNNDPENTNAWATDLGSSRYIDNTEKHVDEYRTYGGKLDREIDVPGNSMMDLSYLLNENLWDTYFISSIPKSPSQPDLSERLSNGRLQWSDLARNLENEFPDELSGYETAAGYLVNVGALNVNSTSVEAWKALFTAFRDLELEADAGETNLDDNRPSNIPVTRSLDPIKNPVDFTFDDIEWEDVGAVNWQLGKDYEQVVGGFRYLTDDMIETLAERIVDEVRLRGPFYSVADFVNRRLVAPAGSRTEGSPWHEARTNGIPASPNETGFMDPSYDPFIGLQGLNGALQRAINVSGINGGLNHPQNSRDEDRVYNIRIRNRGGINHDGRFGERNNFSSTGIGGQSNTQPKHTIEPTWRAHIDTEHLAGAPAGEAGQVYTGASGFVTQGDLLSMIGPALVARGDTFLVRTYGDSINPLTGEVTAKAYLEAVVQRTIEPVSGEEPMSAEGYEKFRPTTELGRKFEIVYTRWLDAEEI